MMPSATDQTATAKTTNATTKKVGGDKMWGWPLEFWDRFVFWSLVVTALAGALSVSAGFAAGVVAYWAGSVEKKEFDDKLRASNVEIENARAVAADATKQAAEANLKAETERLARLKLEAALAPRKIADEKGFVDAIRPYGGTVIHFWHFPAGGDDTPKLFESVFILTRSAGWVPWFSTSLSGQSMPGIVVSPKEGSASYEAAKALVAALNKFGDIPAQLAKPYSENPNWGVATTGPEPSEPTTVIIRIGGK